MLKTISFPVKGDGVLVVVDGRLVLELGWKASRDVCRALDRQIRNAEALARGEASAGSPETGVRIGGVDVSFRQELGRIVFIVGGRMVLDLRTDPAENGPSIARRLWAEWRSATARAEEWASAESIAFDAALLHRSGAPFGITSHPTIQDEARKISDGDRDLRRFVADRRRGPVLGTPTILVETKAQRAARLARSLPPEGRAALIAALEQR